MSRDTVPLKGLKQETIKCQSFFFQWTTVAPLISVCKIFMKDFEIAETNIFKVLFVYKSCELKGLSSEI